MMVELMAYGTEVAVLVSAAAWAAERIAIGRAFARRGCWVAALVLSVAIPAFQVMMPVTPPSAPTVTVAPTTALLPAAAPINHMAAPPPATHREYAIPRYEPAEQHGNGMLLEKILTAVWWTGSAGLLTAYAFLTLRLKRAARTWRAAQIDGQQVWITDSLGPAVYGFIKPIVLFPEWLLQADSKERTAALAHEQSHLEARDPALLLLGLLLVTLFPWNLPLWWQLRRLRFAIEVDCDARVLTRGMTPRDYGNALLAIGERGIAAPLGAVALTEPASQLLRRIQIMTTQIAKPGRTAMLAAIVAAAVCIGVAARTQAPDITAKTDLPRKLPTEDDNSHPRIEALVRATYPQFFRDNGNTQPELVNLFLNPDGSLYEHIAEEIAPRPYITTSFQAFDRLNIDFEHRGQYVRLRMTGASGLPVDVTAWYLQTPSDPTRDVATVRSRIRARYAAALAQTDKVVTVLMTDNGEIDRAAVEDLNGRSPKSLATATHFASLVSNSPGGGNSTAPVSSNSLGVVGVTTLTSSHFIDDPDRKDLPIVYAWPRRANESAMKFEVFHHGAAPAADDDRAVDRQIAEKYFADLYTHPFDWPRADPWVLLDRQGKVLLTGRRTVNSRHDVQLNIESLYPGIKTDQWQVVALNGPKGEEADVSFVWLAADSPITDPAKADFSRQPDVLVYADITSEDRTFYSQTLALNFGSSGVTQCALGNPFGVVYLQLAINEGDADAASVRLRSQNMALPNNEALPDAVPTAWSPQSKAVRALYGTPSAPIEITDAHGKKWTIVLHTDRLAHRPPVTAKS
jgi:beta-lactamase regulating signal transducer with metallopeptidase domain